MSVAGFNILARGEYTCKDRSFSFKISTPKLVTISPLPIPLPQLTPTHPDSQPVLVYHKQSISMRL